MKIETVLAHPIEMIRLQTISIEAFSPKKKVTLGENACHCHSVVYYTSFFLLQSLFFPVCDTSACFVSSVCCLCMQVLQPSSAESMFCMHACSVPACAPSFNEIFKFNSSQKEDCSSVVFSEVQLETRRYQKTFSYTDWHHPQGRPGLSKAHNVFAI